VIAVNKNEEYKKTQMFVSDASIRYPLVYPGSNGGPVLAGRKRQKQESDNSIFRVFRLGRKTKSAAHKSLDAPNIMLLQLISSHPHKI